MKLKSAFKYQFDNKRKAIIAFYAIIIGLYIIMSVARLIWPGSLYNLQMRGTEFSTIIFLLVIGLNAFKEPYHMMLANGVSRRCMFKSFSLTALLVAGIMALVDSIIYLVMNFATQRFESFYEGIYYPRYFTDDFSTNIILEGFLWMLFLYAAVIMLGYIISVLYYRMSKPVKLTVSIGVPVTLFIVLPIIDGTLTSGMIYRTIGRFIFGALGITAGYNPYIAMISCACAFILFGGLSFLAIRKATVKSA